MIAEKQITRRTFADVINSLRRNFYRKDSVEYSKRALIDGSVSLSGSIGMLVEHSLTDNVASSAWLVPVTLGLLAMWSKVMINTGSAQMTSDNEQET